MGAQDDKNWVKVGQRIVPADGSTYEGIITVVDVENDHVEHRCTRTGRTYEKSYFGFFCRYRPK